MAKGKQALEGEMLEQVARRFAVLGEPMRLRLLQVLMKGERSVNDLAAALGATQANTSRHLQTLAGAGLVARRRSGLQILYSIGDPSIFQLCDLVCGSISRRELDRSRRLAKASSAALGGKGLVDDLIP